LLRFVAPKGLGSVTGPARKLAPTVLTRRLCEVIKSSQSGCDFLMETSSRRANSARFEFLELESEFVAYRPKPLKA
jgi:hypothetical protein